MGEGVRGGEEGQKNEALSLKTGKLHLEEASDRHTGVPELEIF